MLDLPGSYCYLLCTLKLNRSIMKSLYEYTEKVEDLPEKKHGITK